MLNRFLQERELIGEGRRAKVYRWNGFAYKCFEKDHPQAWMDWEYQVNTIIHEAGIPCAAYYPSEFSNSLKMELISGVPLFDRMLAAGEMQIPEIYYSLLAQIHSVHGLALPHMAANLRQELAAMEFAPAVKEKALRLLQSFSDGDALCHMDFHGYNILCTQDGYRVIDWVTAQSGDPILDYARTYVLHYEVDKRLAEEFAENVYRRFGVSKKDMQKAVYIMALKRQTDFHNEKCLELLEYLESRV